MKEFKGTKGKQSVGVAPEYNNTLKSAMIEIHTNNVWVCKVQNNGIIQSEEGKTLETEKKLSLFDKIFRPFKKK